MDTEARIQARIEAAQTYEAIDYGIRSIDVCRGPWGASACHAAQIAAAITAAEGITGQYIAQDNATRWKLMKAKKAAAEAKKAAEADLKTIGTKRQIRLALAA